MQPDVAPAFQRHGIAEPLVGQLVRNQPLRLPTAVAMIGPERRKALCLNGMSELIVGDDDGVAGEQVRPEHLGEGVDHVELPGEVDAEVAAQPWRVDRAHRKGFCRKLTRLYWPICTDARYVDISSTCWYTHVVREPRIRLSTSVPLARA